MPIDVPKRLFATVPDYVAESLDERAKREGRSTSNLVAFILEQAVQQELEHLDESPKDDSNGGDR
ncbi:MAG: ribbon-helix-helix protein, CopG family [Cyanobacteria bacterium P01_H01_bin.153]